MLLSCVCVCVMDVRVCVDLCCQEEIQISALQGGSEHFWIALPNKDRPDLL